MRARVVVGMPMVTVPAVEAARNGIAGKAANRCSGNDAAQASMTDCAADRAAANGSQDRTGYMAVAAANIGLRRDGCRRQRQGSCREKVSDFVQHRTILSDLVPGRY